MSQKRIAYLLSCVLMAPAAVASASASAEPASSPLGAASIGRGLSPSGEPGLATGGDDGFLRALHSMELSRDQQTTIANLAATFCDDRAVATDSVAGDERSLHADIKGVLEPAQREQLDDRVVQLEIEERVIGRLRESGNA